MYANKVEPAGSLPAGTEFYISAIYGEKIPAPVPGKISEFDVKYGENQIVTNKATATFDDSVHYGEESGALKITITETMDESFGSLKDLTISDVSGFDYLVFRVYHTNDFVLNIGLVGWAKTEWCTANKWTEVKINVSEIEAAKQSNLNGFTLWSSAVNPWAQLAVGTEFYLSAIFGVNE